MRFDEAVGNMLNQNPVSPSNPVQEKTFLLISWEDQTLKIVKQSYVEAWLNKQKKIASDNFTTETEDERKSTLDQISLDTNPIPGGGGKIKEHFIMDYEDLSFVNLS